jgi:hypothetical protein
VDDDGEPSRPKQRHETRANLGPAELDRLFASPIRSDGEIPEIPEVRSLRVQMAVAEVRGIEMGPRGLETWRFALADGVEVEPMLPRGEPGDPYMHLKPLVPLPQRHAAYIGALGVAQDALHRCRCSSATASEDSERTND